MNPGLDQEISFFLDDNDRVDLPVSIKESLFILQEAENLSFEAGE